MFKVLLIKAIQVALCQLYGLCLNQPECDGEVCQPALDALDDLDTQMPAATMAPTKLTALDFDFQWDKFDPLVKATVEFINALKAFLGLNRVG